MNNPSKSYTYCS